MPTAKTENSETCARTRDLCFEYPRYIHKEMARPNSIAPTVQQPWRFGGPLDAWVLLFSISVILEVATWQEFVPLLSFFSPKGCIGVQYYTIP